MSTQIGNKRWGIVALLVLTYFVLYSTRTSMAITKSAFGWDAAQFGWVNTAFFIGYALSMMPAGALGDKFGGGKVLCGGILFFCLFTLVTPFAAASTALAFIIVVRVLVGIGQGFGMPGIASTIAQWVPKAESGRAQGFCLVGIPLATSVTWAVGPKIMDALGPTALFVILAATGPVWVILWKIFGADRPEQHKTISKQEVEYIRADQTKKSASDAGSNAELTSKDIFGTPSVWAAGISYFCSNYLFFLFLSWLPTYFKEGRGWSLETGAYPYLAAVITYPLGGVLADLMAKKLGVNAGRKLFPILGLALAGIMLVIGSRAPSQGVAVLCISLSNGFLCLTMGGFFSIPMEFSPKNAGKIVGFNGMWGTAAGILAPLATGYIIQLSGNNYDYALYVGAGVAVIGALIMLFGCKVKPIEHKTN